MRVADVREEAFISEEVTEKASTNNRQALGKADCAARWSNVRPGKIEGLFLHTVVCGGVTTCDGCEN